MSAPSEDIKDMLEAESSLVFGTDLFIGKEPASPVDCVTIFDTPGRPPDLTFENDSVYSYPAFQIRVRNAVYLTGWNLINSIKTLLHGKGPETRNSTLYHSIACSSEPAFLDWDENSRARFVSTFEVQRT